MDNPASPTSPADRFQGLDLVREGAKLKALGEAMIDVGIIQARDAGGTWQDIATNAEMTHPGVMSRYRRLTQKGTS